WHAPFYFVAGLGVLIMPFLVTYTPNMTAHREDRDREKTNPLILVRDIIKDKDQRLGILLSATMMMGHFLIIPFLVPFMELNVGFTNAQTPLIYFVGGALTLFTSPIIGRLA